jgi:uncharacterized membrane protein
MLAKKFSKEEAIRFGWDTMKNNLRFFIGLVIIFGLIQIVPGIISEVTKKEAPALSVIINIASMILSAVISMGLIRITIRFCDNDKGEFADLFAYFPILFQYLFVSILYGLIVFGGFILLIVPGIIWSIQFSFYGYFIVDKKLGPIEALKKSSLITKGAKWDLFLFGLMLFGINLLGALCLLIGLFATFPTAMVASAFVYRKLSNLAESAQLS